MESPEDGAAAALPRFATQRPPATRTQAPGLLSGPARRRAPDPRPRPRTLPTPAPAPAPTPQPAYRHHFGPEPHRSGWPDRGSEPSGGAQGVARCGGGERRGRPPGRRRTCCKATAGGGAACGSAEFSPRSGAPPSPGPTSDRAPGRGFVYSALATARTPPALLRNQLIPGPGPRRARAGSAPRAEPRPRRARLAGGGEDAGTEPRAPARARGRREARRLARARVGGRRVTFSLFAFGRRVAGGARRSDRSARLQAGPGTVRPPLKDGIMKDAGGARGLRPSPPRSFELGQEAEPWAETRHLDGSSPRRCRGARPKPGDRTSWEDPAARLERPMSLEARPLPRPSKMEIGRAVSARSAFREFLVKESSGCRLSSHLPSSKF